MSVTIDLSTGTDDIPLNEVFHETPDAWIVFEPLVQQTKRDTWSFWVRNTQSETTAEILDATEHVRRVHVIDTDADGALFEIEWVADTPETTDGFLTLVTDHDAAVLKQVGTAHGWEFTLRFPDTQSTTAFQRGCHEAGIPVTITRVQESNRSSTPPDELTSPQREVFTLALERGYFEIPRGTTLVDLAEEVGISDQAASERIRRAQTKLGRTMMSTNRTTAAE